MPVDTLLIEPGRISAASSPGISLPSPYLALAYGMNLRDLER